MAKGDSLDSCQSRTEVPRQRWHICLAAADRGELLRVSEELGEQYHLRVIRPATSGLGMLQIRDSVRMEGFHLGEFTLATAAVELTNAAGDVIQGGAAIMQDDERLAIALAVLDGVLSAGWGGRVRVEKLLEDGDEKLATIERERSRILAMTAVDFSTLDQDAQ